VDQESILKEKEQRIRVLETENQHLKQNLEKTENHTSSTIDEFRKKAENINDTYNKANEQYNSLQKKFQLQTQFLQEKNQEVNEKDKLIENMKKTNSELRENYNSIEANFRQIESHNENYKQELNYLKKEKQTLSLTLDECNNKSNFVLNEMNERVRIVNVENERLTEENNRIKTKLNQLYGEIKNKDEKLITNLKDETTYVENKLNKEINELKIENENLMRERAQLRTIANESKYESQVLKEQLHQNELNNSKLSTSFDIADKLNTRSKISKKKLPGSGISSPGHNFLSTTANNNQGNFLSSENNFLSENKDNKEIKALQKDKAKLIVEVDELTAKVQDIERLYRGSQNGFQAADLERTRFKDMVDKLEGENHELRKDISRLKESVKDIEKMESLLGEIKEKNQTINYLIEECDKVKAQSKDSTSNLDKELRGKIEEIESLTDRINKHSKEMKNSDKKYNDLLKENKILIQDLDNLNKDVAELHREKMNQQFEFDNKIKGYDDFTGKMKNEYEKMKEENKAMKKDLKDLLNTSFHNYDILMEKLSKGKTKRDKLVSIYESHIELLKQRFTQQIKEITNVYNMKVSDKDQISVEKYLAGFDALRDKIFNTSQYEATIESYKRENKQNKQAKENLTATVKKLTKENEELKELCNVKKLQMKLKKPGNKTTNDLGEEINNLSDHELIIRLMELEKLMQENIDIKAEENEFTSKINVIYISC